MTDENLQRGSDHVNVHQDDEMKKEMQGRLRSGHPTRAEEWNDPEPEADDDPEVTNRPLPPMGAANRAEAEAETLRSDLARHLGRRTFPADRQAMLRVLIEGSAPDELVDTVRGLPHGESYRNVQEVVIALGRKPAA